MKYILYSKSGSDSAKLLARILGMEVSTLILDQAPSIRWGNTSGYGVFPNDTNYNRCDTINIVHDKLNFSFYMKDKGIPYIALRKGEPEKYPVIIRTIRQGADGSGIVVALNKDEWKEYSNFYYSYYVPFDFEVRLFLFEGKIIKIYKKEKKGNDVNKNVEFARGLPLRITDNGYDFYLKDIKFYPKVVPMAEKFYKALSINICALDLGWDTENKQYVIVEANTCPFLTEPTAQLLASLLKGKV